MNKTIRYIYIILIIVIVIELIFLLSRLLILKKELDKLDIELESVEQNLNKVKEHMEAIEKTKDSWKFFLSIYLILSIFKLATKDYKKTNKANRSYVNSLAKVCAKNITTIKKIRIV